MVGAPHVDLAIEAALALVLVVGDVRGEVGVLAAGAHQHAVLVVAVVGRAQPQSALAAIGMPALLEQREHMIDRAGWLLVLLLAQARKRLVKRTLIGPAVEALNAKCAQGGLHAPDHYSHRGGAQVSRVELRRTNRLYAPTRGTGASGLSARPLDCDLALYFGHERPNIVSPV